MSAFESKKFSWKDGWNPNIKAEIVGGVFEEIEKRDGQVTSKSFLDASRDEDSPTHSLFLWNDAEAAEKYRLSQSHRIISQLQVEIVVEEIPAEETEVQIEVEEMKTYKAPAYLNVNPVGRFGASKNTTGSYVNLNTAMSNEDMRKVILENVLNELSVYQRKYFMYKELSEIFDAIDSAKKRLGVG